MFLTTNRRPQDGMTNLRRLNNILGLHLSNNSATVPAVIEKNLFYNNNVVGNNYGRAIYTDGGISGGMLQNVLITDNAFLRNQQNQARTEALAPFTPTAGVMSWM